MQITSRIQRFREHIGLMNPEKYYYLLKKNPESPPNKKTKFVELRFFQTMFVKSFAPRTPVSDLEVH